MTECMMFPDDWAKFLEDYSFRDCKEVYTNGARLIPTFRVEQMMKHYLRKCVADTWIPVTERLPEVGGCYLVALKYKYDFEKEYTYDTDVATFHFGYDRRYIDGQWNTCVDWDEGQQYLHVTHWMPLPEPPKEENNA